MAARGEIDPPDAAIFADTQAEPDAVMSWLDFLDTQVPFTIHRVTKGNLRTDQLRMRVSKKTGNIYAKNEIPAE